MTTDSLGAIQWKVRKHQNAMAGTEKMCSFGDMLGFVGEIQLRIQSPNALHTSTSMKLQEMQMPKLLLHTHPKPYEPGYLVLDPGTPHRVLITGI